jgi:SsrA-binding protein
MDNIAENRRGGFDHEISERYEAGIELHGQEVKSARGGRLQLAGAHVLIRGGEAWLLNSHIAPYQANNVGSDYEMDRARRLLLNKDEIKTLQGVLQDKGLHLIPLRAYLKKGFIKIELGLGRSRKKSDKREVIKKREHQREMERGE